MPHARLLTAIIQSTGLKSEWNFHITWTTFPVWFSFFSHFYPIHDSEHYLNTLWDKIINARNFLPSHCHVCFFKKHKACVVWLMHCNEHFGQEGDKLGVSSTKSVVDILPQRTSSREENTFFCVVDRWNGIFFTRYCSHFPLFTSDGCCNWFSRLSKISPAKKIDQKMRHSVFYCFPQILLLLLHAHSCDAGDHR